jgi:ELWxxDGT repeat protein
VTRTPRQLFLAASIVLAARLAAGSVVHLDANRLPGSNPTAIIEFGGQALFSADDGSGREPWISDGTPGGTTRIADINPAGASSPSYFVVLGGIAYFFADDGVHGKELWRTDGTGAGTWMVKDINPTGNGVSADLVVIGTKLVFPANDGAAGMELWSSDGTAGGTAMLVDINPSSGSNPGQMKLIGSHAYFEANDGVTGTELWRTDGTAVGTERLSDANTSGNAAPRHITGAGGLVFFTAITSDGERELHATDGTPAGTYMVEQINPTGDPSIYYMAALGSEVLFRADDGTHGRELWISDGTPSGTEMLADINPSGSAGLEYLTTVGSEVFFAANDGSSGKELWVSDGTPAGTKRVKDIDGGAGSSSPREFAAIGTELFFRATDGTNGNELWKSDGTEGGTLLVKDLHPGGSSNPFAMTLVGSDIFLAADDGTSGWELHLTNGTVGNLSLVADINMSNDGNIASAADVDGTLFFRGNDGFHGGEIWKSDGTPAGTVLVEDIAVMHVFDSNPAHIRALGSTALFVAYTYFEGAEWWRSNGTAAGTYMVDDIGPGTRNAGVQYAAVMGGALYFNASNTNPMGPFGSYGNELWKAGTSAGSASLVKDIRTTPDTWDSSDPRYLTPVGSLLYFGATDGVNGRELWTSNGTGAGTSMVEDLVSGSGGCDPREITAVGTKVFFRAQDGSNDWELYVSEGSAANTFLVKDIRGDGSSNPAAFTALGTTCFFTADDGTHGKELWKSVGTGVGTEMVEDTVPGATGSNPTSLCAVASTLYFAADDASGDRELYKSLGTAGTTARLKDINPSGDSSPRNLVEFDGFLYFTADDGIHGEELWRSDGLMDGTVMVQDIYPGPTGSAPSYLTVSGGILYFIAEHPAHGKDLVAFVPAVELSVTDTQLVEGDGSGNGYAVFTVSLWKASAGTVTVHWETADGTAEDEGGDGDYDSASGDLTFTAGQVSKFLTIYTNKDSVYEPDETFDVVLSGPVGATIYDGVGTCTILNDDPGLVIDDVSLNEGDAGTTAFDFTASIQHAHDAEITVWYRIDDGTATDGALDGDYVDASDQLVFGIGQVTKTVSVTVNADTKYEPDETFSVVLYDPVGAVIDDATGVGVVLNDDATPAIAVDDPAEAEGDAASDLEFTVTLSNPSYLDVSVDYTLSDGTAEDGTGDGDYVAATDTVTIPAGDSSVAVVVAVNGDTTFETDETLDITLSSPVNAVFGDSQGTGTITNDDPEPQVSVGDASVSEGAAGATPELAFPLTLTNASYLTVSVECLTSPGTADEGVDYDAASGTIDFAPGAVATTFPVSVNGDGDVESDETLNLLLQNPVNATTDDALALGTIVNDDAAASDSGSDSGCLPGPGGGASPVLLALVCAALVRRVRGAGADTR